MTPLDDLVIVDEPPIEYEPVEGDPIPKRILGLGSPKSGTTYLAWFLRELGLKVEHERMGEEGTVNAAWILPKIKDDTLQKEKFGRQHFIFNRVIHIVRHPLQVIASFQALPPRPFLRWQYLWTGIKFMENDDPPAFMLGRFWIWWTDVCESQADFTIRLDDIAKVGQPRNRTAAPVKPLTWHDIKDDEVVEHLQHRVKMYGWEE